MADDVQTIPSEATPEDGATATAAKPAARARAGKPRPQVPRGRACVSATYNNTIVTITDPKGDVLAWSSAGSCGFRGPKKATPYAASIVVREVLRKLEGVGLKEVSVFVRGVGSGRESAVRALHANGLHVASIKDVTPIPHNGCRPPKPRRI
ncbi:30S ribosomal protein S11 [Candidatus Uhrbacteria bacterium]|nr:30S ribosomal protein S11 [Candidatus Uhrbacteria bacterium]